MKTRTINIENTQELLDKAEELVSRYGNPARWTEEQARQAAVEAGEVIPEVAVEGYDTVVFTGLPQVGIDTPESWSTADDDPETYVYSAVAFLVASALGGVYSWRSQQDGRLVTDIIPTQGGAYGKTSESSSLELGWHTEDAFSDMRPDYVGLYALRNTPGQTTTVAGVNSDDFTQEELEMLQQPRFKILPDDAHEGVEPVIAPLLEKVGDDYHIRADEDFVLALDEEANEAYEALRVRLKETMQDFYAAPGCMAFVDNRKLVHGRRAYEMNPEEEKVKRWLKRTVVTLDRGNIGVRF